jgi:hypothetical protein
LDLWRHAAVPRNFCKLPSIKIVKENKNGEGTGMLLYRKMSTSLFLKDLAWVLFNIEQGMLPNRVRYYCKVRKSNR